MSTSNIFRFGNKAQTLERLGPLVTKSLIPEFVYFSVAEWHSEPEELLLRVARIFGEQTVIVRSSALDEDGSEYANAGLYDSIPDVPATDATTLTSAIDTVISSYDKVHKREDSTDHILIQVMINQVVMSGALFTHDLTTGSPYYVINYDDQSGRTDTVTSGNEYSNRTLYVHRGSVSALYSQRFKSLIAAVEELEQLIGPQPLDIEFALDLDNRVYLFQVRQITTHPNWEHSVAASVDEAIRHIQTFVHDRFRPIPGIRGSRSLFGQMPDWNPAEMIGRAPRPLASSLYRYLITDRAWRQARQQMGYAVPHGMPLMVSLGGQPFIDVRLSFHSYLPADLPEDIGENLVNAWLDRLAENPQLHDKVEFDVAITCLALDFTERMARLYTKVLSQEQFHIFHNCLRRITRKLIDGSVAPIAGELAKIEQLNTQRSHLLATKQHPDLATVSSLLEDCIELGTIPFSVLARHAFIAQSFLRTIVGNGILTQDDSMAFQRSVRTVVSELADDTNSLLSGKMDQAEFMQHYGHLRPGTYDILSPRYDQREDLFDYASAGDVHTHEDNHFSLTDKQIEAINRLLSEEDLGINANTLFDYCSNAIAAREYAKFIFTRNISDALEAIAQWGEKTGLNREELSYLDIRHILETLARVDGESTENHLRALSQASCQQHKTTVALRLPQIVCIEEDVHIIPLRLDQPNFITTKSIRGHCVRLHEYNQSPPSITNNIVLIEKADPGFDWIFAYGIKGLITKYGGSNSHMAIRCAEFGIPAAIGCGEQIFERVEQAHAIELKCAEGIIRPVKE